MKWGILTAIVLVVILGGVAVYILGKNTPAKQVSETTPTPQVSQDSSDTALDKDFTDVSTKLNALNQDSANIDVSLNDKQGNLSEN
jgi:hypothetical protein